jgi:hypothetical protein
MTLRWYVAGVMKVDRERERKTKEKEKKRR